MFRMKWIWTFLFVLSILAGLPSAASAQQTLTYGGSTTGTLSATAPVQVYTFSGEAGDFITVQVMTLTSGLQPTLSVIRPNGQSLPTEVLNLGSVSQHNAQLGSTGVHTIIITSGSGGLGDFALTLSGQPGSDAVDVSETGGESVLAGEQVFMFAPAETDRQLTVQTTPPTPFTATLRGGDAGMVALQSSGGAGMVTFALPGSSTGYTLAISSASTGDSTVTFTFTNAETPAAESPTTQPPSDETASTVTPPPADPTEVTAGDPCVATSSNGVNVRSGPSTDYAVVGALPAGTSVTVLGISEDGGWYYVQLPGGGEGWIFGVIMMVEGDCSNLPTIPVEDNTGDMQISATPTVTVSTDTEGTPTATPSPTRVSDAPTATHTPSFTPTQNTGGGPTATYTPSYTPTVVQDQPTATYTPSYTPTTPPAAQVAPEDARFNNPLTIPLDNTASVLDFVSYPGGDNEDRVRWDITGMNQVTTSSGGQARLVISVSCFGQNTDQVQFFTGGQTYSCGQTIVDREVTFNSKTGSVVITAVGGDATYVQWVLTGTATRIN